MTASGRYTSAPGTVVTLDTIRLGGVQGLVTAANQGTVAGSQIDVPDKGGVITLKGLHRFYFEESACSQGQLWNGYLANRDISRGPEFTMGADRLITVHLVDLNTLLENYIIQGAADATHGKRPAETDVQRVAWLLTSAFLPQVHDEGNVDSGGGTAMDACDYRGQNAGDVLRDCGTKSGRNWFVYYDSVSGHDALFYKFQHDSAFTSTLSFSNVPGDADGVTCFEMMSNPQPTQGRDPARVMSSILQNYSGGAVFRSDTDIGLTTHIEYYVRQKVGQSSNTKSLTVAKALADRQLHDNSDEEDAAHFSVLLPKEAAGLVQAGHRVSCRFSHFEPEYRSFSWWRITQLTLHQDDPKSHEWYRLDIDASPLPVLCDPTSSYPAHYTPALGGLGATPNPVVDPMGPYYMKAGNILDMPGVGSVTFVQYPNFEYAFPGTQGPWVDKFPAGYDDTIDIYCQGDGTLTVRLVSIPHVLEYPNAQIDAIQYDYVALPIAWGDNSTPNYIGSATLLGSTTVPNVITEYSFHVVSVDPTNVSCYHYVHIEFQTPAGLAPGTACYIGLDGFTWVPDE